MGQTSFPFADDPDVTFHHHGRPAVVRDIMDKPVSISTGDSIEVAATKMRDEDTGMLIVIDNETLVGVVTDRDIVVRVLAADPPLDTRGIDAIMSRNVVTCREMQPIPDAAAIMGDYQKRRLPVLNVKDSIVGVISLDKIAEDYSEHLAGETLGEIVERR